MDLNVIEQLLVDKYTDSYPSEEKQIGVLLEASDNNELTENVINYLLNDEDNNELINILESYLNDLNNSDLDLKGN